AKFKVKGVKTTIPFHRGALAPPAFVSGNYTTEIATSLKWAGAPPLALNPSRPLRPRGAGMSAGATIGRVRNATYHFYRWRYESAFLVNLGLAGLFACLTGFGALIKIYLPWTPVPITGQVFFVLASAVVLGKHYGGLSQVLYAFVGILGVPLDLVKAAIVLGIGAVILPNRPFARERDAATGASRLVHRDRDVFLEALDHDPGIVSLDVFHRDQLVDDPVEVGTVLRADQVDGVGVVH